MQVRDYLDKNRPYCFELYSTLGTNELIKACKTDAEGRVIEGNHTVYRMSAATKEEKEIWVKCIRQSVIRTFCVYSPERVSQGERESLLSQNHLAKAALFCPRPDKRQSVLRNGSRSKKKGPTFLTLLQGRLLNSSKER